MAEEEEEEDRFRLAFLIGRPRCPTGTKASGLSLGSGTVHGSRPVSISISGAGQRWATGVRWLPLARHACQNAVSSVGRDSKAASSSNQGPSVRSYIMRAIAAPYIPLHSVMECVQKEGRCRMFYRQREKWRKHPECSWIHEWMEWYRVEVEGKCACHRMVVGREAERDWDRDVEASKAQGGTCRQPAWQIIKRA